MHDPSPTVDPVAAALGTVGPLTRSTALALLARGDELMASGDFQKAALHYQRVVGFDDAAITAAAWLGFGDALYRMDAEPEALSAWTSVLKLPETRSTYRAWRNVAAARVRSGDLPGAIAAYREADRRAPLEDKPEIAGRLGWLAKESGDRGAARRYFARSRGDAPTLPLSYVILGITVVVSMAAMAQDGSGLFNALQLDKGALRAGELYRLWSPLLLHAGLLHLAFNMYALYLIGPLVEGIWGSRLFALFYLLTGAVASTASLLAGPIPAVGASGAIFGLVGVLMAGTRAHHPVLDQRARAIIPQLGTIVLINLALGFFAGGAIDNAAHIGGLVSGLWLGLVVPPGRVPTLRSMWQRPEGPPGESRTLAMLVATAGVLALVIVTLLGLVAGGVSL